MCLRDDAIQKVSVVVASGKSSGRYSGPTGGISYSDGKFGSVGGWTTGGIRASTELARTLTPPPMPKEGGFHYSWKIKSSLLSFITIGVTGFSAFILFWSVFGALVLIGFVSIPEIELRDGTIILGLCGSILGLIVGIFGYLRQRKYIENLRTEKERAYALDKRAWAMAINKWNRLYFCHRDGVIFDPGTGETSQPASLIKFTYTPPSKV